MNALVKVSLRYGVLAGIIGSGLLIALYYIDRHPLVIPVYLDFRIILFGVFIFFTLREIRDYHHDGILYFWQGIIASFLFTVCFAVIASLAIALFIQVVPAFLTEYIDRTIEQMRSFPPEVVEAIGKDVYERNIAMLPSANASQLAGASFGQSFLISLFISIILSVTLRRQPKI